MQKLNSPATNALGVAPPPEQALAVAVLIQLSVGKDRERLTGA